MKRRTRDMFQVGRCPLCEGPREISTERPGEWIVPRTVCIEHQEGAVLPNGDSLTEFLGKKNTLSFPLEGIYVGFVVNPLLIGGKNNWMLFTGGGLLVLEEIFPSRSFVEFMMQHDPERLDSLYSLNIGDSTSTGLGRVFQRISEYDGMLGFMVSDWVKQKSILDGLRDAKCSFPNNPAHVVELLEIRRPPSFFNWYRWIFSNLDKFFLEVAEKRFAHLF